MCGAPLERSGFVLCSFFGGILVLTVLANLSAHVEIFAFAFALGALISTSTRAATLG